MNGQKAQLDRKFMVYCGDLAARADLAAEKIEQRESMEHLNAFNFGRRKHRIDDQRIIRALRNRIWLLRRDQWLKIAAGVFFGFLLGLAVAGWMQAANVL